MTECTQAYYLPLHCLGQKILSPPQKGSSYSADTAEQSRERGMFSGFCDVNIGDIGWEMNQNKSSEKMDVDNCFGKISCERVILAMCTGEDDALKSLLWLFKKYFIYFYRGREGEREVEKHQCLVASCMPSTGDLAHNVGMCPDWESNQQPFDLQASTQSTELH